MRVGMTETVWDASPYLVVGATYWWRGMRCIFKGFVTRDVVRNKRENGWDNIYPSHLLTESYLPGHLSVLRCTQSFIRYDSDVDDVIRISSEYDHVVDVVTDKKTHRIVPFIKSIRTVLATSERDKAWERRRHLVAAW